jgi:hypothetical protein
MAPGFSLLGPYDTDNYRMGERGGGVQCSCALCITDKCFRFSPV